MKISKYHYSFYISEEQYKWLEQMAELNGKSKSYFVRLAIDLLKETVGGIPNGL